MIWLYPKQFYTKFSEYVFKAIELKSVEMTVAWKMCVQQSNTVDICDIKCVWRALCMADCCDKDSARFVYRADCHSYHCKYKFNWCIAHQSSCSDTYNFECNGVFVDCLKKIRGEIINCCRTNQEIEAHTLKSYWLCRQVWDLFITTMNLGSSLIISWCTHQTFNAAT